MPAVCRGNSVDADVTHCSTPRRDELSPNVLVNGTGISRQGDNNTPHLLPGAPCPTHAAPITTGSTTVFINGNSKYSFTDTKWISNWIATNMFKIKGLIELGSNDYFILKKQVDIEQVVPVEEKIKIIDIKNEAPQSIKYNYISLGTGGGTAADGGIVAI